MISSSQQFPIICNNILCIFDTFTAAKKQYIVKEDDKWRNNLTPSTENNKLRYPGMRVAILSLHDTPRGKNAVKEHLEQKMELKEK